jgi:hypothetical protein
MAAFIAKQMVGNQLKSVKGEFFLCNMEFSLFVLVGFNF